MEIHTSKGVASLTTATYEQLKCDKGQSETGIAVEEEAEGDVHALDNAGIRARCGVVEIDETSVRLLLRTGTEELRVNAVPISVVLINFLPTTSSSSWILITGLDYTLNLNLI